MAALTQILSALSPPPFIQTEEYDGLEYRYRFFVFRPALFQREAALLAGLLAYVAFFLLGRWSNARKATKWYVRVSISQTRYRLDAHLPILQQQFSRPKNWTQDGYSDFFNFSTGRRNVASLHTIFTLRPRHDFLQWAFQTGRTFVDLQYRPTDDLQLDFKLLAGALSHDFVWAVVSKDELLSIKDDRWDLTFTKTTENPALPSQFSVMSEFADVTEGVFKAFPLTKFLEDPKIAPYFRSLSITDQPRDRPLKPLKPSEREQHVILSLKAPSALHAADTAGIVAAIFPFIDALSKVALRPETKIKLKKVRDEIQKDIKIESERDKKEEALEAKKAAKRKAEEERIAKLSAGDQKKILEKERKRSIRKQQGKLTAKK
ncbi:hypothetical protein B0H17DRAFT_925972 [Mycena rosella]|uniref:DUF1682-domain-containing protein n=1 Tax=Mycena rosella TaxID=1033263 RepID=A0AAD7DXC5_MYCRO|nr:hypothetical protein B0H17DRAFT_925972 [Mycena rosella]